MRNPELSPRIKNDMNVAMNYNLHRKPAKHLAEMELIKKAVALIKPETAVLDAPCGTGRAALFLHQLGYQVRGADLGSSALILARENAIRARADVPFDLANVMELPYADNSFEASLCFRFYHHLGDDALRKMMIKELCRISKKQVLISYFSPFSFTSIKRRILRPFSRPSAEQYATSLSSIKAIFAENGFKLVKNLAQCTFIHTLNLAVFERTTKFR